MMLSEHFSLAEMTNSQTAARLGIFNQPDDKILANLKETCRQLEGVRKLLDKPILISSGYRSIHLNRQIGGVATSAHCQGYAVDFIVPSVGSPLDVCKRIESAEIKFDQLIYEGGATGWVHISFDPRMRQHILTAQLGAPKTVYKEGLVA